MKRLLLSCLMLAMVLGAQAVPAKRGQWRSMRLADGRTVEAELRGDEFGHYWQDEQGLVYLSNADGWLELTDADQIALQVCQRRAAANAHRRQRCVPIGTDHQPYVGKRRGLIILVEFQDQRFLRHETDPDRRAAEVALRYDSIANAPGYSSGRFVGSVRDYFLDNSYGQFDLTFDVVGPILLEHDYAYYGQDNGGMHDMYAGMMITEACNAADESVDFATYDWDNDGEADQVFVLYAGMGQANGGNENTIWPHESRLTGRPEVGKVLTLDGIDIDTYGCSCELGNTGETDGIGTICHEFCHCLGLPDLYDTAGVGSMGMGNWDVMDHGSYNADGFVPAGLCSYDKIYAGWLTPTPLNTSTEATLRPLSEGAEAYVIRNEAHPDEYLLLENRQPTLWDAALPGHGLLALHVDFDLQVWQQNVVNSLSTYLDENGTRIRNTHQRMAPLCADGRADALTYATDTYPLAASDCISSTSQPAMSWYNVNSQGNHLFCHAVSHIAEADDHCLTFDYQPVENTDPVGDFLLFERFDRCDGRGGNDDIWSGSAGAADFVADYSGWTATAAFGANQCAKLGTYDQQGQLLSPTLYPEPDRDYALTFRAAPFGSNATTQMVVAFVSRGDTLRTDTLAAMPTKQWSDYRLEVPAADEIELRFSATQTRFFIDEIHVGESGALGIAVVDKASAQPAQRRYDLGGRPVVRAQRGAITVGRGGRKVVASAR